MNLYIRAYNELLFFFNDSVAEN